MNARNGNTLDNGFGESKPRRLSFDVTDIEYSELIFNQYDSSHFQLLPQKFRVKKSTSALFLASVLSIFAIKYLLPHLDGSFVLENFIETKRLLMESLEIVFVEKFEELKRSLMEVKSNMLSSDFVVGPSKSLLWSLLGGLMFATFSWYVIYLDSSIPGINPPTPFTVSKKSYSKPERKFHLGYITAIFAGVIVFLITYF